MNRENYKAYIASPRWKAVRQATLLRAHGQCQRCGATEKLEVHHLTYDRLGNEIPEDLLVVCHPCHEKEDQERALKMQRRTRDRRLDGWASKVYGENWWEWNDQEAVEEEFEEWLEGQDDGY